METERIQFKSMKSKELIKLARKKGLQVETNNGRHGVHLVAVNGNRMPVPMHGGRQELAKGTLINLLGFIQANNRLVN